MCRILVEHEVPVYHCVQEEGQFMITFPKAYHAGFNHGVSAFKIMNSIDHEISLM
jgi:histone demethylase JARID1